jgi:energy-converting hydrogenase Eha subunit A
MQKEIAMLTELIRRAQLLALLVRVYLLILLGLPVVQKKHTARSSARRSPSPWGFEARKVGKIGNRAYAVRLQLVAVSLA